MVLLFFDPDEPGTTDEKLSKLLQSLGEMDHKLLIDLNKANQLKKIHDFARAYGSLCWKLSKVIPRKDLPRIFTMCLPVADRGDGDHVSTSGDGDVPTIQALAGPACTRRGTTGDEGAEAQDRQRHHPPARLDPPPALHAVITEDVRSRFSKRLWENRIHEASSLSLGKALAGLGAYLSAPPQLTGDLVVAATVLGVGGMRWFNSVNLKDAEEQLLSAEELVATFQRTHPQEVSEADEFFGACGRG